MPAPHGLSRRMQAALKIAHQSLQAFASASGRRQVVGDHSRMAKVQQKSGLFRGKAQEVLVVVVDDFHQVCKRDLSVVGRNPGAWMGKAVNRVESCKVGRTRRLVLVVLIPQAVAWRRVAISTTINPKRAMAIRRELGWVMSRRRVGAEP